MNQDLTFHHIGLACASITEEGAHFSKLGFTQEGALFEDPLQKIKGCFMVLGPFRIELLEPLSGDSPLQTYLRRGVKMYHQAFLCADLSTQIDSMTRKGAQVVVPPVPAVAFGGRKISFLMLPNLLLVELIERP
jgi:methylmalonyl-CoA/ethylmalonyl-CoA epimerase